MNDTHRIQFEKPNIDELRQQYTVVDLHFHSHYSDGHNSVAAIAGKAYALGIGIAITDHNEIEGAIEIDRYPEVFSIPGIEVTSKEGTHVLIYFYHLESLKRFYRKDVKPHMGIDIMSSTALEMEDIIKRARKYKTIIVFPHPYCGTYTGICNSYFPEQRFQSILGLIDGVEVINSENMNKWNLRSALLGFNLDKGITGGSDGHRLPQMGKVVTYAPCKPTRKAFLDAIKQKQSRVIGKEIDIIRKVTSNSVKLRTNLKNYPDLVEKNLKYSYAVINSKSKTFKDNMKRSLNDRIKERRRKFTVL
ncbi:MAG: PHP domain-containing protein [Desulfobacterales bacterium]|nr:MAG: PHP domain-containing protein [Desulfobacterales bacterium]